MQERTGGIDHGPEWDGGVTLSTSLPTCASVLSSKKTVDAARPSQGRREGARDSRRDGALRRRGGRVESPCTTWVGVGVGLASQAAPQKWDS